MPSSDKLYLCIRQHQRVLQLLSSNVKLTLPSRESPSASRISFVMTLVRECTFSPIELADVVTESPENGQHSSRIVRLDTWDELVAQHNTGPCVTRNGMIWEHSVCGRLGRFGQEYPQGRPSQRNPLLYITTNFGTPVILGASAMSINSIFT